MKFGTLINTVKHGNFNTITPATLVELGNRYLEKYPKSSSRHSHQGTAQALVDFATTNPGADSEKCCNVLMKVLQRGGTVDGWLAKKSVELLNKGLGTSVPTCYSTGKSVHSRSVSEVVGDFEAHLDRRTKTVGIELQDTGLFGARHQQHLDEAARGPVPEFV
ncbi:hypothetical protein [Piscirickettsia litoralis]|uniref:Uncharacterized protein n=1 Tax=Piscirickettsia litoralis TaxID=1891921 RepID=A0ABX3A1N4_9GAMM|nr:hypothetical protein [Piscirickettsia litoralis]ODN42549.1 hypothetical protein BGC07_05915 [Piscirickettsia litoralis]